MGLTEWAVRKVTLPPRLGLILEVSQERRAGSTVGQESPRDCEVGRVSQRFTEGNPEIVFPLGQVSV